MSNVVFLAKLFEHNNWANLQIIQACSGLSDDQLDAEPRSATKGSIRATLLHLVRSQQGYLRQLTLPLEARVDPVSVEFADVAQVARASGQALIALTQDPSKIVQTRIQTRDGYWVEPWVLMVQIINHATEHREQIKSMLSALGLANPEVDGWTYGEVTGALVPISTSSSQGDDA